MEPGRVALHPPSPGGLAVGRLAHLPRGPAGQGLGGRPPAHAARPLRRSRPRLRQSPLRSPQGGAPGGPPAPRFPLLPARVRHPPGLPEPRPGAGPDAPGGPQRGGGRSGPRPPMTATRRPAGIAAWLLLLPGLALVAGLLLLPLLEALRLSLFR